MTPTFSYKKYEMVLMLSKYQWYKILGYTFTLK